MFSQSILGVLDGNKFATTFSYDECDPFAISIKFSDLENQTWVFARDLLNDAFMAGTCGEGDVFFEVTDVVAAMTMLGTCTVGFPRIDVEAFLYTTFDMVPPGTEVVDIAADFILWFNEEAV